MLKGTAKFFWNKRNTVTIENGHNNSAGIASVKYAARYKKKGTLVQVSNKALEFLIQELCLVGWLFFFFPPVTGELFIGRCDFPIIAENASHS